jgi:hypothetical protein
MNVVNIHILTHNQQYGLPLELSPSKSNDNLPSNSGHLKIFELKNGILQYIVIEINFSHLSST